MTNIFANPKTYDFLLTNKTNHFLIIGGGLLPPEKNVQYTEQAQPIKLSKLTGASFNDLRANYRIEDATRDMFDDPNVLEWTAINGTEDVPDGGEGGYVSPYPSPSLSDTYLKATIANGNTTYSWSTVPTGGGEGGGEGISALSDDTSPRLGGDLDVSAPLDTIRDSKSFTPANNIPGYTTLTFTDPDADFTSSPAVVAGNMVRFTVNGATTTRTVTTVNPNVLQFSDLLPGMSTTATITYDIVMPKAFKIFNSNPVGGGNTRSVEIQGLKAYLRGDLETNGSSIVPGTSSSVVIRAMNNSLNLGTSSIDMYANQANANIIMATREVNTNVKINSWDFPGVPSLGASKRFIVPEPTGTFNIGDTLSIKNVTEYGPVELEWKTPTGGGGGTSLPESPFKGSGENATYALTSYKNESDEVIQEWTDIHETKANRLIMQNWYDPVDPFIQRSGGGSLYWGSPSAGDTMVFDLNSKKIAQGVLPYPYPSRGDDGKALVTSVDAGGTATYSWGDVGGGQRQSGSYDIYDEKGNDIFVNYTIYPDIADHIVNNSFEDTSRDFSSLDYTPVEGKSDWYLLIKVEKTGAEEHFKTKVLSTASMYSVMIEEMPNLAIFTDADTISYSIIRVKLGNVTNSNPVNKDFSITGGAIEVNKVVFPSNENYVKKLVLPSLTSIPTTGSKLSVISETSDKVILGFESAPVEDNFTNCYKLMEDFDFSNTTEASNTTALLARGWETSITTTASVTAANTGGSSEHFKGNAGNYKNDEVGLIRINVTKGSTATALGAVKMQHNVLGMGAIPLYSDCDFDFSFRFRLGQGTDASNYTGEGSTSATIMFGLIQRGVANDGSNAQGYYVQAYPNMGQDTLTLSGRCLDSSYGLIQTQSTSNPFFNNQILNNYRISMRKRGEAVSFSVGGAEWTDPIIVTNRAWITPLVPTIIVAATNTNVNTKVTSVLVDYIDYKMYLPNRGLI